MITAAACWVHNDQGFWSIFLDKRVPQEYGLTMLIKPFPQKLMSTDGTISNKNVKPSFARFLLHVKIKVRKSSNKRMEKMRDMQIFVNS